MNLLDVFIIITLVGAFFRGREIGFVRQLSSAIGFFAGLWLGALLEPHVVTLVHSQLSRLLLTLLTTLGMAFIMLTIGEYVGILLKQKVRHQYIDKFDGWFGTLIAGASCLAGAWLAGAILVTLPYPNIQSEVRGSAIISWLDTTLPPAPNVIASLGRLIDPNGFPQVFSGNEPAPPSSVTLPALGDLQPAVQKDMNSVVKVEGQGCGGIVEGSGFVVGDGLIATNAHVVAGIHTPYVSDGTDTRSAVAIWFDPNLDFAVLRVNGLKGSPLVLDTSTVSSNTPGAVLGYPGGGNFSAKPAAVIDEFTATGRNIYGQGATTRDVYEVSADIIPGNSGGPLIAKDGTVIGVVFAESTSYNHVGYALASPQVLHEINQAEAENHTVSTGKCAE